MPLLNEKTSPRVTTHVERAPLARVGATAADPGYNYWSSPEYFLSLAGSGLGAYHGYKRNEGSIGWAIGWGVLGYIAPVITTGVALAQGFGKPAEK